MQLSLQQNGLHSAAFSPEKRVAESFSSVLKDDDMNDQLRFLSHPWPRPR